MSTKVRYELIDGWPAIVYPDGRVRPVVQGGDGPTDENENDENETAPPAGPDGLDQLQNELTRIGTRENAAGRRAAERDLLQSAGFSNRDEFDRFVREAREREEAQLTETQRQQKAAEDRERQAEQRERAAAEREHRASIATALVDADVPRDRRQLVERLVDVEVGADEATIAAAIDAVREQAPELFTGSTKSDDEDADKQTRSPSSLPRGAAPRNKPTSGQSRVDELVEGVKARTGIR